MAIARAEARLDRPSRDGDDVQASPVEAPEVERAEEVREPREIEHKESEFERDRNADSFERVRGELRTFDARAAIDKVPAEPGRELGEMETAKWGSSEPTSWETEPAAPAGEDELSRIGAAFEKQDAPQMIWTDFAVEIENRAGREQGGLTPEQEEKNAALAGVIAPDPNDPQTQKPQELDPIQMAALVRESGVALEKQDPNQLVAATNYVNRATSAEDQQARLQKALNNFSILDKIGTPKLNEEEFKNVLWDAARIPGHAIDNFSADKQNKTFQDVAAAMNTPGKSEFEIDKKYKVKLETNQKGEVVGSETKKKSPWKMIGKIALNVGLGVAATFTGGATLIAARLISAGIGVVNGIKNKSLLGTIAGAAGAFGAAALGAGASTAANVANGIARGARALQSGISAFRSRSAGGVLGALAEGASTAAGFVANGAESIRNGFDNVAKWANRGAYVAGIGENIASRNFVGAAAGIVEGISDKNGVRDAARMANAINNLDRARRTGDAGLIADAIVNAGVQARALRQSLRRDQTVIEIGDRREKAPEELPGFADEEAPALLESRALPGFEDGMIEALPAALESRPISAELAGLPETKPYTVRKGDTIEALAARNGLTTRELLEANGLDENSARRLQIGAELQIPLETSDPRGAENLRRYRENAATERAREGRPPQVDPAPTGRAGEGRPPQIDPATATLMESDGYKLLPPALRAEMRAAVAADPRLASNLTSLANSGAYRNLNDATKHELLASITRAQDSSSRGALLELAKTPGLAWMNDRDKMNLVELVGGLNRDISEPQREEIAGQFANPAFRRATPAGQAEMLRQFLTNQPGLPFNMASSATEMPQSGARYSLRSIPTAPSRGGQDYVVEINGQRIPISYPPRIAPGTVVPTPEQLAIGLAALPEESRRLIGNIAVQANPDRNTYMSVGGSREIAVYPTSRAQTSRYLRESLDHEVGHIASQHVFGWSDDDPHWDVWERAMAEDGVAPSRYARTSDHRNQDDFAETWALYNKMRGTPLEPEMRRLFGARFREIEAIRAGQRRY